MASSGPQSMFVAGQWNAICDRCGAKFKSGELRKTWQGFYCCSRCWEPRHPQDFVRGAVDDMTPPWTRPVPADVFATFTPPSPPAIPGVPAPPAPAPSPVGATSAIPGIAIPGNALPNRLV